MTDRHIAGIAVRNPQIVAVAHYYGVSIATCVPADPESKGGSESTVRLAKADLVPTDHNLLADYESWEQLVAACDEFMDTVNGRVHRATGERPVDRLEIERAHLHAVPADPYTAAFGETRAVGWSSTLNHRGARYSVPHVVGRSARVGAGRRRRTRRRGHTDVGTGRDGPAQTRRHRPGQILDAAHYPNRRSDPLHREPRARTAAEAAFSAIGQGAATWLVEAAAVGTRGLEHKIDEAVELTKVFDRDAIDRALGQAAIRSRFAIGDLLSILTPPPTASIEDCTAPREPHSLQPGTGAWSHIGPPATLERSGELGPSTRHRSPAPRRSQRDRTALPAAAPALHAPPGPRRRRHRQGAALGPRRSPAGAARRRSRRPRPRHHRDRAPPRRLPQRQDL